MFTSFGAEYYISENSSLIGIYTNKGNDDDTNTNIIGRFDALGNVNESTLRIEDESEDENRIQYTWIISIILTEMGKIIYQLSILLNWKTFSTILHKRILNLICLMI